ncbi:MAG: tRNA (N(6)-L-threonylcarbamoyladenosine(37)-C(2))-methylthiotransferase MtaB [Muribaculaceae bacterium]|nr:tRNA (N(6)-L-threonylcarbamoyladenosine(37)-C(2))-methylthiotransferase MtaB [Muribaculaceae bacterium]
MTDDSTTLRAAYYTLGCKLNYAETSAIGRMLAERGVVRARGGEAPDICVVNTCSVTETADKKGRRLIRSLAARYPDATMVVTGCYAQLKPEEVAAVEGVDIVLGSDEKLRMADFIDAWRRDRIRRVEVTPALDINTFRPSCERGDRTRYWLKVQDGCDYFCTYCTIPFARGRSRSGRTAELVEMARRVAAEGGKEIVLTGVNVGCFGLDTGESFLDLLKALDGVEGIERYRISSIEPNLLTEEIVTWIARESRAFMPSFHVPLQSGSDAVLRLMNRRYDTALFASRIQFIRSMIPDAFIAADIIAGARGETPGEWEKSLAFAEASGVDRLHVFPYSERPGTRALGIDHIVSQEEKHRRVAALSLLSDRLMRRRLQEMAGETRPVLWEHPASPEDTVMHGHTDNYIRVSAPADPRLYNMVTPTLLTGLDPEEEETMAGVPQTDTI